MELVLDTNTLVSGTLWSGPPSRLLDAVETGGATLALSAALLAEFGGVVGRGKLALASFEGIPVLSTREAIGKLGPASQ